MTRDNALKYFEFVEDIWDKPQYWLQDTTKDDFIDFINKIYDAHEAELKAKDERIAELTQEKSCDGCEYENQSSDFYECLFCTRHAIKDNYTPKK